MAHVELVEKVKREHVGKWIGLKDGNVVAISDNHEDLFSNRRGEGVRLPILRVFEMEIREGKLVVRVRLGGKRFRCLRMY